jgi:hypothetical protein
LLNLMTDLFYIKTATIITNFDDRAFIGLSCYKFNFALRRFPLLLAIMGRFNSMLKGVP